MFGTILRRAGAEKLPEQEEIERFGADGEEVIYRILCENFDCVIRNAVVPHKKLYLEKDFAVLEKGVLFVLEVKYWKGEIFREGNDFCQLKENGVKKKLKSPVGTTRQFVSAMCDFYGIDSPVVGMVVFAEPDCSLRLPEESEGIALMKTDRMVSFIKSTAKAKKAAVANPPDPSRILRCTRFYSEKSEFCKGILADCFFDCYTKEGAKVRIDTTCLRYLSAEHQPLLLRDRLLVTYTNGSTGVYYNKDTVFTVGCLDGSYRKIALNRINHIVF